MSNSVDVAALCAVLGALAEDDRSRVPLLIALLSLDGHERHEGIVFALGLSGDPAAIPAIAEADRAIRSYHCSRITQASMRIGGCVCSASAWTNPLL